MRRSKIALSDILFRASGILLLLTMLTLWLVIGLYAKYTVSGSASDSASVANGLPVIELKEHKAVLDNGIYKLKDNDGKYYEEVTENEYEKVIPGVDIAKDPYITLNGVSEVDFVLYVKITEENFPAPITKDGKEIKIVTYELNDKANKLELVDDLSDTAKGIYVYKRYFDAGSVDEEIYLLKDNRLIVSQYFDGSIESNKNFKLTFEAWAEQAD